MGGTFKMPSFAFTSIVWHFSTGQIASEKASSLIYSIKFLSSLQWTLFATSRKLWKSLYKIIGFFTISAKTALINSKNFLPWLTYDLQKVWKKNLHEMIDSFTLSPYLTLINSKTLLPWMTFCLHSLELSRTFIFPWTMAAI